MGDAEEEQKSEKDRIQQIKELLLSDEAIGEAVVYGITVVQSVIEFDNTKFENQLDFQEAFIARLEQYAPFSPRNKMGLNEGFLYFQVTENRVDFHYIKEIAFRWEFVNNKKNFESLILKKIDSSYRVRIAAVFENNKVTITLFGGTEPLVIKAKMTVLSAIKLLVHNFKSVDIKFSLRQMQKILSQFGEEVTLINIDPRDNEKFTKFIERQNEENTGVDRVALYDVFSVRMSGLQITVSPEVSRLIKENGIRITETKGSLFWSLGIKITTRVRSNGRVEFFIPSYVVKNDSQLAYSVCNEVYAPAVPTDEPPEKGPLERFL